jgi:hypothetical protein
MNKQKMKNWDNHHVKTINEPSIIQDDDSPPLIDIDSDDSDNEEEKEFSPTSLGKILRETKPLRSVIPKISTDIKGPFSVPGLKGELYYQGFVEEDTKFNTAYFSQHKSDSLAHTHHHWNEVLKAEGSICTTYQADGAPELISKDICKLLTKNETRMMWSPAYTPELNAIIERNHRTIFEGGHAMLVDSNKPQMFWCEAVLYSSAIFNAFPTNTKFGMMSPIEAKFGAGP